MKIQELEQRTGLERASIRFYEKEGLLSPKRLENGYRDYSDDDVLLLKKIKLLRRLGMSVEKIRQLQQGSEDLNLAIAQLTGYHSSQIEEHRRCRAVCEAMYSDGISFEKLDAEHYWTLLRTIRIDDKPPAPGKFQENLPQEIHPWRRYFARWMDIFLWGGIFEFIYLVILRIRPVPKESLDFLVKIAIFVSFVPVEAVLLSCFGTTPGKYAMGIRVESIQGRKLNYSEALYRSLTVFTAGCGLAIPLVQIMSYLSCYCRLTGRVWKLFSRHDEVEGPQQMPWDEECELIYRPVNWKRGVAAALVIVLAFGISTGAALDAMRPRYRGSQLTVAQVAHNYNSTLRILNHDYKYYDKLREDGTRKPVAQNTVISDFNSSLGNYFMEFAYEVQDGIVRSVSASHEWDRVTYLKPLESDVLNMACSLVLAQEDCGARELAEFRKLYAQHQDSKQGSFRYRNLTVEWEIDTDLSMNDGILHSEYQKSGNATLFFKITIEP